MGQTDPVDEVCIDFSPLRTIEVAQIAQDCLSEAKKYDSHLGTIDNSDVNGLGWNVLDIQTMLEEVSAIHTILHMHIHHSTIPLTHFFMYIGCHMAHTCLFHRSNFFSTCRQSSICRIVGTNICQWSYRC